MSRPADNDRRRRGARARGAGAQLPPLHDVERERRGQQCEEADGSEVPSLPYASEFLRDFRTTAAVDELESREGTATVVGFQHACSEYPIAHCALGEHLHAILLALEPEPVVQLEPVEDDGRLLELAPTPHRPDAERIRVPVTGRGGIPATGVSAVAVNVTATAPTNAGNITVHAGGTTAPGSVRGTAPQ